MFFDEEGPELKAEKAENGGGVDVGKAPLALLSCVMDDSKAGPGISSTSTLVGTLDGSECATHWCCFQILARYLQSGQNCCYLLIHQ